MKRNTVDRIIGTVILASLLLVSQNCWAQLAAHTPSKAFSAPFRTYSLAIPADKVWLIVISTISETKFAIRSEDENRLRLVAIGQPYSVHVGLGKKKERKQVIVEMQQKRQGIYDCYIKIEVYELWPVYNRWTKRTDDVDTTDLLFELGRRLTNKLKSYFKKLN